MFELQIVASGTLRPRRRPGYSGNSHDRRKRRRRFLRGYSRLFVNNSSVDLVFRDQRGHDVVAAPGMEVDVRSHGTGTAFRVVGGPYRHVPAEG